jgi:oligopeptide/dipeptide ABC transporter ATP-binding protein
VADTAGAGPGASSGGPAFAVRDVTVRSARRAHRRPVLHKVSLDVGPGEIVGLVGESGCGKTTLCRLVAGLLPERMTLTEGTIMLDGRDITALKASVLHRIRPRGLSMVFQDPLAALNPVIRIGDQVAEALDPSAGRRRPRARDDAAALLRQLGLPDAGQRLSAYPAELSGGQRQRVVLAMALATDPVLLLADEPTSSLDVRTQAQILRLLADVADRRGVAILLVSHDFGVISEICRRVCVMYAGEIVEMGPTAQILTRPAHPYTARLIESLPSVSRRVTVLPVIAGRPPTLEEPLPGCSFYPRCPQGQKELCTVAPMVLTPVRPGHATSCVVETASMQEEQDGKPAEAQPHRRDRR